MRVTYTVEPLDTAENWAKLAEVLGDGHPEVVQSTIRHLRILDVKSYVLEDPYIDRDYSADYLHFYARTFRTYPRHCKRAHFSLMTYRLFLLSHGQWSSFVSSEKSPARAIAVSV